jgi:hypothetical protein
LGSEIKLRKNSKLAGVRLSKVIDSAIIFSVVTLARMFTILSSRVDGEAINGSEPRCQAEVP